MLSVSKKFFISIFLSFFIFLLFVLYANASTTNGTIDSTNSYAWGENVGWINFGASQGNVAVTSSGITGYAWGENVGWISLNCSNDSSCGAVDYGIKNTTGGQLSGYAWGENIGWVDFRPTFGGVGIDGNGEFTGYAWGENIGWVVFNCSTTASCGAVDYKVSTDWRTECNNGLDDDRDGKQDHPQDPGCNSISDGSESSDPRSGGGDGGSSIGGGGGSGGESSESVDETIPIAQPTTTPKTSTPFGVSDIEAPSYYSDTSNSLGVGENYTGSDDSSSESLSDKIRGFAFETLPEEVNRFVYGFPSVREMFNKFGEWTFGDVVRGGGLRTLLPGITGFFGSGDKDFSIPSRVMFVRGGGGLFDMSTIVEFGVGGREAVQTVRFTAGSGMQFVVRPDRPAVSVEGTLIAREVQSGKRRISLGNASIYDIARRVLSNVIVDEKDRDLVVAKFKYRDDDNDGVFVADVNAPNTSGAYDVITRIEYEDDELDYVRLGVVVRPTGYVYRTIGSKKTEEVRISNASVEILVKNKYGKYVKWDAYEYGQKNPYITDETGEYSFLVPAGDYKVRVEVEGYDFYESGVVKLDASDGIYERVRLVRSSDSLGYMVDWRTAFVTLALIVVGGAFYRIIVGSHL
jgi:hypothetical protein